MGARRRGGGAFQKWASVPRLLFCVRTDVAAKGAGTQILAQKNFFLRKNVPPHMCSQNDQRDVGIILSHVCWGWDPPPPPGRWGSPSPNPLPGTATKEGEGRVGQMCFRAIPPPPPAKQFSSRQYAAQPLGPEKILELPQVLQTCKVSYGPFSGLFLARLWFSTFANFSRGPWREWASRPYVLCWVPLQPWLCMLDCASALTLMSWQSCGMHIHVPCCARPASSNAP